MKIVGASITTTPGGVHAMTMMMTNNSKEH